MHPIQTVSPIYVADFPNDVDSVWPRYCALTVAKRTKRDEQRNRKHMRLFVLQNQWARAVVRRCAHMRVCGRSFGSSTVAAASIACAQQRNNADPSIWCITFKELQNMEYCNSEAFTPKFLSSPNTICNDVQGHIHLLHRRRVRDLSLIHI